VSSLSLGGPGPGCSATRMRRLAAGELHGAERARLLEHLAGCARCQETQREFEEEARVLAAALPFEDLAAGVAERLARAEQPAPRRALRRWVPVALAATLVAAAAVPLVARFSTPSRDDGIRLKGSGPSLTLYLQQVGGARAIAPGDAIPGAARLRLALAPGQRKHVAVLLLDADGVAVLYAGRAVAGPLPDAFEWTGAGEGTVLAVLSDRPIETDALVRRVEQGGVEGARSGGAEVVTLKLIRRSGS
jgi:predicted anti-sigma-YlaC factor YlaD